MGGKPHDLSRPRARTSGVRTSRCRRRSRPAGSHAALVAAALCESGASGDQQTRPTAVDQTRLTHRDIVLLRSNRSCEEFRGPAGMNLLVTIVPEYLGLRGEGNRTY